MKLTTLTLQVSAVLLGFAGIASSEASVSPELTEQVIECSAGVRNPNPNSNSFKKKLSECNLDIAPELATKIVQCNIAGGSYVDNKCSWGHIESNNSASEQIQAAVKEATVQWNSDDFWFDADIECNKIRSSSGYSVYVECSITNNESQPLRIKEIGMAIYAESDYTFELDRQCIDSTPDLTTCGKRIIAPGKTKTFATYFRDNSVADVKSFRVFTQMW